MHLKRHSSLVLSSRCLAHCTVMADTGGAGRGGGYSRGGGNNRRRRSGGSNNNSGRNNNRSGGSSNNNNNNHNSASSSSINRGIPDIDRLLRQQPSRVSDGGGFSDGSNGRGSAKSLAEAMGALVLSSGTLGKLQVGTVVVLSVTVHLLGGLHYCSYICIQWGCHSCVDRAWGSCVQPRGADNTTVPYQWLKSYSTVDSAAQKSTAS